MNMATASSSSTDLESRNWLELPEDITTKIIQKLDPIEILVTVQMVCRLWWRLCTDSSMWRRIDMTNLSRTRTLHYFFDLDVKCRTAVNRSDGQLNEISISEFATDNLLHYIANRSNGLKCLRLLSCDKITDDGLIKACEKLHLLEELELTFCPNISEKAVEAVGKFCCLLNSFKLNICFNIEYFTDSCDDEALAIAENMPGLRKLQLVENPLTENGLRAILNGCPLLESLDLRRCFYLQLDDDLIKTCTSQVKSLKLPGASMDDFPTISRYSPYPDNQHSDYGHFDYELSDHGHFDKDYNEYSELLDEFGDDCEDDGSDSQDHEDGCDCEDDGSDCQDHEDGCDCEDVDSHCEDESSFEDNKDYGDVEDNDNDPETYDDGSDLEDDDCYFEEESTFEDDDDDESD